MNFRVETLCSIPDVFLGKGTPDPHAVDVPDCASRYSRRLGPRYLNMLIWIWQHKYKLEKRNPTNNK